MDDLNTIDNPKDDENKDTTEDNGGDGLELFEDFLGDLDEDEDGDVKEIEKIDEVEEVEVDYDDKTKIMHWLHKDFMAWHPVVNRPPRSGWYIAYLVDQEGKKFQWVAQFDKNKTLWTCPLPFLVVVSMWTYFPVMPMGHGNQHPIKENW